MPFSILDVDMHQTSSWVNSARFSSFDSNQNNDQSIIRPYIENHQPLTTPNGSMVGSSDEYKVRLYKFFFSNLEF